GVPTLAAPLERSVLVADVEAAGEGDLLVHHQQLAVVADRPAPAPAPGADWMEGGELHAGLEQGTPVLARQAPRAGAVHHHAHADPGERTVAQRVVEAAAGGIALEDIRLEQYLALRRENGGEHRRIGLRAVHQDLDAVAGLEPVRREAITLAVRRRARFPRLQGLRIRHAIPRRAPSRAWSACSPSPCTCRRRAKALSAC